MHYYYYYFPIKTCFVRVDLLFGELLIMIEFIIRVVIVVPLTTGSCTNKKKKKMPLEVDNDGYHSLTEMFSIIHLFLCLVRKIFKLYISTKQTLKDNTFLWRTCLKCGNRMLFEKLPWLLGYFHTIIYWIWNCIRIYIGHDSICFLCIVWLVINLIYCCWK